MQVVNPSNRGRWSQKFAEAVKPKRRAKLRKALSRRIEREVNHYAAQAAKKAPLQSVPAHATETVVVADGIAEAINEETTGG